MTFIPVNKPLLNGNEKRYLIDCVDSGWISSEGPYVKKFEELFSAHVNKKFGIAVSSGTGALEIAVAALELENGDEVIMPTATIISCILPLIRSGIVPVFVDSDPATWNMDVNQIEKRISKRTKAIMIVHTYGLPVDMDPIKNLAKKYDLRIVEDAAEASGQHYKNEPCGSFGDIGVFSFYPNKLITTGEGGMVVTDDPELQKKCRLLRNLCFQGKRRFIHEELGWNYRITNLQAALGVAQLERLDESVRKKKEMGKFYLQGLSDIKSLQLPLRKAEYAENLFWVFGVVLENNIPFDSDRAIKLLADQGIQTRPFFWPMHQQPVFKKMGLFKNESYPVSERLAQRGFYLPSGLGLTREEQNFIIETMRKIFT